MNSSIIVLFQFTPSDTTTNRLDIRAIALDELGIYFAGENQLENMAQQSGTVRYIRSGEETELCVNFFEAVMSIVSTSPGNQPYPAGMMCDA